MVGEPGDLGEQAGGTAKLAIAPFRIGHELIVRALDGPVDLLVEQVAVLGTDAWATDRPFIEARGLDDLNRVFAYFILWRAGPGELDGNGVVLDADGAGGPDLIRVGTGAK